MNNVAKDQANKAFSDWAAGIYFKDAADQRNAWNLFLQGYAAGRREGDRLLQMVVDISNHDAQYLASFVKNNKSE